MLGIALMIILAGAIIAALPLYPYSRGWRYYPAALLALMLGLVVCLWLIGAFPMRPMMHLGGPSGATPSTPTVP